jgi:DNA-binding CsgD family transcriptional regulator
MTRTLESSGLDEPPAALPRKLAAIMLPELPSLTDEIITKIRRDVPEYARPLDGPFGQALRDGVVQSLTAFVDHVADPAAPQDRLHRVCRRLGSLEAREGRSLDSLQAAYRIGAHVAWRRAMKVGERHHLSSSIMSQLADALFAYINQLASLSLQGFLEAKAQSSEELRERRRRLLGLLLELPPASRQAVHEAARFAGWTVPDEVTLVALRPGTTCAMAALDDDVLVEVAAARPHLLIPGDLDAARSAMLEAAVTKPGAAAVGLTVPLAGAADSLRWARRALSLADAGVIDESGLIRCEDHLMTLWLRADDALVDELARRQFVTMAGLTPRQRSRLTETLRTWLESRGSAAEIADRLQVHPQTVRYRMRQLERTLGDRLNDPDSRFAMEVVLRATRLGERSVRSDIADSTSRSETSRVPRGADTR